MASSRRTFTPSSDAYVSQDNQNTNYGSTGILYVDSNIGKGTISGEDITLMEFNLSTIPPHATINSATLRLYLRGITHPGATNTSYLFARSYYFTNSNIPWLSTGVTWNTYDGVASRTWFGGTGAGPVNGIYDYDSISGLSVYQGTIPGATWGQYWEITTGAQGGTTGPTVNLATLVTRALPTGIFQPNGNLLLEIRRFDNSGAVDSGISFDSMEGANPPQLVVTYTLPSGFMPFFNDITK